MTVKRAILIAALIAIVPAAFLLWNQGARKTMPPQPYMLLAGAALKVKLMNGVDAPTGKKGKSSPVPVLLRVTEISVREGGWFSKIDDCFVSADAYGIESGARVMMDARSISCVNESGAIQAQLQGVVVDNGSAKVGLPGMTVLTNLVVSKIATAVSVDADIPATLIITKTVQAEDWKMVSKKL